MVEGKHSEMVAHQNCGSDTHEEPTWVWQSAAGQRDLQASQVNLAKLQHSYYELNYNILIQNTIQKRYRRDLQASQVNLAKLQYSYY